MHRTITALLLTLPVFVFAQVSSGPFPDTQDHPHQASIELLRVRGVVQGYGSGLFRPDIPVNRAEFLKMLMLARYGLSGGTGERCFEDFIGAEQWFWTYACDAKEVGILDGYPDGTFRGGNQILLAEALKMSMEAWDVPLPQYFREPDHWYDPYMDTASGMGLFRYFPSRPDHILTRSEAAELLVQVGDLTSGGGGGGASSTTSSRPRPDIAICGNNVIEGPEQCDDGNRLDGDGCSSICISVPEPIRHGSLRIEQRAIGDETAVAGAQDLLLLSFDAVAGREDVSLTDLVLAEMSGDLGVLSHISLLMDKNGDGTAERVLAEGSVHGDRIVFSRFQVSMAEGRFLRFEVRGDLRGELTSGSVAVGFATEEQFVSAVGEEDDRDLTGIVINDEECAVSLCWIRVFTVDPRTVTVE